MAGELIFIPVQILVISGRKSSLILYKILKSWMDLQSVFQTLSDFIYKVRLACSRPQTSRPMQHYKETIFDGCEFYFLLFCLNL